MNLDGKMTMAPVGLMAATTVVATVNSASVQSGGFRYTMFVLNSFYASGVLDVVASLQDSADGTNFTDIGTVFTLSHAVSTIGANAFLVRHEACRQYVRLRITRNSGATVIASVSALRYGKINSSATSDIGLVAQ